MPAPKKGPRLGGGPAHERLILSNLVTALFEHDRITTTEAKAKRLRPYAEHLITFGKRGDLHARRQVLKRLNSKSVVHTLFADIGPRFENRPGGYTRIVKVGPRKGDNAPMAVIELVEALTVAQQAVGGAGEIAVGEEHQVLRETHLLLAQEQQARPGRSLGVQRHGGASRVGHASHTPTLTSALLTYLDLDYTVRAVEATISLGRPTWRWFRSMIVTA